VFENERKESTNMSYVIGLRAVEHLLSLNNIKIRKLYVEYHPVNKRILSLINEVRKRNIDISEANRGRLTQICGVSNHQGIVAVIKRKSFIDESSLRTFIETRLSKKSASPIFILILDGIQDPHNLGACLRTANACGVDVVITSKRDSVSLNPTVSKVSSGGSESLLFSSVKNIEKVLEWLSDYGVVLIGTSDSVEDNLFDSDLCRPLAFVMGSEDKGLRKSTKNRCDEIVSLPMSGTVSSLNVSVATGICLYEALRQRTSTKIKS
tara:strand:+ start:978 stop:1775 length:798 start_codon:yes stop_codon:yes gene_type:complete